MSILPLRIAIAQVDATVGDLCANAGKILDFHAQAEAKGAELVVFPECFLSGYPPEDLVLSSAFQKELDAQIERIRFSTAESKTALLFGTPRAESDRVYNEALLLDGGKIVATRRKHDLPNYGVFDEKRVFAKGDIPHPFMFRGKRLGILVCEEMWNHDTSVHLQGAELLLVLNASPYAADKLKERYYHATRLVNHLAAPLVYVNMVGAQDDLGFDGASFMLTKEGILHTSLPVAEEALHVINDSPKLAPYDKEQTLYKMLVLGLKSYVAKNNFPGVLLGMSGGIDSALVAAIAVDALGKDKVRLIMMPSRFTSQESLNDAKTYADELGIALENIPIEPMVEAYHKTMPDLAPIAQENLQSRIRGAILMSISNSTGYMVVSTGNKSEISTGYATLYGDMCGGYSPLKDVYKTAVFALSRLRGLPENIISKPPTAELRENQKDEDSLPPYEMLDQILYSMLEENMTVANIVAKGFDEATVKRVYRLVHLAEYKRRQAAPGVNVTTRPFGRDRRYPITNRFVEK